MIFFIDAIVGIGRLSKLYGTWIETRESTHRKKCNILWLLNNLVFEIFCNYLAPECPVLNRDSLNI